VMSYIFGHEKVSFMCGTRRGVSRRKVTGIWQPESSAIALRVDEISIRPRTG
jgi:hypothetical protein